MTGGRVVILGSVGKNFAAGMSGGIAYVLADDQEKFKRTANKELVLFESLEDEEEIRTVYDMISKHFQYTESPKARHILDHWEEYVGRFIKVIPRNYKLMISTIEKMENSGLTKEEAVLAAFEAVANEKTTAGEPFALQAVAN